MAELVASERAWTKRPDGLRLRVRLTPRSSRDCVDGTSDTADGLAIAARVRAVPDDGKANAALEIIIANWLDQPRSSITLAAGHKSRIKLLDIAGNPTALVQQIETLLTTGQPGKKKRHTK